MFQFQTKRNMHPINQHPVIQFYKHNNAFGRTIGMTFELVEPGKVIYKMKVEPEILAQPIAAHGGAITALMDATLGVAALSLVCEDNQVVSTVELSTNFLKPALIGDHLVGEAELIHRGKRLLYLEGKIKNQKGEVVAAGKGTFNAYPIDKAVAAQSNK